MVKKGNLAEINRQQRPKEVALPQSVRFVQMSKELGGDDDAKAFKARLDEIARHKTKDGS